MSLQRDTLVQQLHAETALHSRLTLWSNTKDIYQDEMIAEFGFAIEAVSIFEENMAQQLHQENTAEGQETDC